MKSNDPEESMTIGELADRFGLRPHVLRHWEATGLLAPASRVHGRRRYTRGHIARVAMIVRGKAAGFSLEQLRAVLEASSPADRRELLRRHQRELEERIRQIEASKALVEHALECPEDDFTDCPAFRRLVEQM
ncbi:MerR family transcriptional regulator [Streptomyces sp. 8N616]|uniref:MerR family transcriptional regulator n=1 Tax=Streptomyces sp. 8N616 TaxID=3457414 RepID=UPI003FCFB312